MKEVKTDIEAFARIRVVGVGGSGKNAVNHMIESKVRGVEFISVNTDAQDLQNSLAKRKIHIGKNLTRGLGAGGDMSVGKRAAEETKEEIYDSLKGSDMVFITCGMGGGTGTGASSVVAKIAREMDALTVAVVTKPFAFEGQQRMRFAEAGLDELKKEVDALIVIPNDRLLAVVDRETSIKNAFAMCDDILKQAVEGISDLITTPGIINVDFADIKSIMENAGSALMGIGLATGEKRAEEAARAAINSPLLELSIAGAKGVLFTIAGGDDLGMLEVQDAAKVITESIDPNARVIFGAVRDDKLKRGDVRVTVIATGFPEGTATGKSTPLFGTISASQTPISGGDKDKKDKIEKKEEPKGQIHNTFTPPAKKTDKDEKSVPKKDDDEDDSDWGAVPAFLRRSKIK